MVDYPAWGQPPARFSERAAHEHNRLIASVGIDEAMRREVAREIAARLRQAKGPAHLVLPLRGIEEWDRPGAPLHDAQGLQAFMAEMQRCDCAPAQVQAIDAHINDAAFAEHVLAVFDAWLARGLIARSAHG